MLRRPAQAAGANPTVLGRSQVVRQRILIPPFPGSNPGAPANQIKYLCENAFPANIGLSAPCRHRTRHLWGQTRAPRLSGAVLNLAIGYKGQSRAMPYISKKEQEEARWMPLTEAIQQIQTVDKFESEQALKLLIKAILDQDVRARMDGRKLRSEDLQGRVLICLESPGSIYLDRESTQRSLVIFPGPVNDPEDLGAFDYMDVTILRDDVNRYWPIDGQTAGRSPQNKPHTRRPPPPSRAKIIEVARIVHRNSRSPNMYVAERLIRKELPGATRNLIRPILKLAEFEKQRRRQGKQPE